MSESAFGPAIVCHTCGQPHYGLRDEGFPPVLIRNTAHRLFRQDVLTECCHTALLHYADILDLAAVREAG